MAKIESLCRPAGDSGPSCIACCRPRCPLLDQRMDNGLGGCLGHGGKVVEGLTQTDFCKEVTCWDPEKLGQLPPLKSRELAQEIQRVSSGRRYNPRQILDQFELGWKR